MTQKFLRDDGVFAAFAATGSSASGPITLITASISTNTSSTTTGVFVDGPSVAQGTAGTWYVSGHLSLEAINGAASAAAKLWDGTTVIDSGQVACHAASATQDCALSGFIASPAGNLRLSFTSLTGGGAGIVALPVTFMTTVPNASTITAMRIG